MSPLHRRIMAVRAARPGLFFGWRDGTRTDDVLKVCDLSLEPLIDGVVMGVPMEPEDLLQDQERALQCIEAAVAAAAPLDAVGLGSICALVAGRGEALAEQCSVPVTNGGAATAWALLENTRAVIARVGCSRPVAVVGARGPVGTAVAALLAEDGIEVRVDHPRAGRGLDVVQAKNPEEAVTGCRVVVGAGTTGKVLSASALSPDAVVVDVALRNTAIGRPGPGVQVLAGEAVSLPSGWRRGGWGWIYHLLAGYGPSQAFACLIEPLVLALSGRKVPYAIGRTLEPSAVRAFGADARSAGFEPRLATGWQAFPPERIPLHIPGPTAVG